MATNKIRKHDVELTASDVGAVPSEVVWLENVDVFATLGTNTFGTRLYKFGVPSANAPSGWTYFSVLQSGHSAIAFGGNNKKGAVAISRFTSGAWGEWVTTDDMYLPLTGGTLSGNLGLKNGKGHIMTGSQMSSLYFFDDVEKQYGRGLAIVGASIVGKEQCARIAEISESGAVNYYLFGQHNKPSGSYTGNGSATERIINTGGIGRALFLSGYNYNAIVGEKGACYWGVSGDYGTVKKEQCSFANGVLTLATVDSSVNANNGIFYWQVL